MGRIDKCYELSKSIVDAYNALEVAANKYGESSEQFLTFINKISRLVPKECVEYSYLNSKEVIYVSIMVGNTNGHPYSLRFKTRLDMVSEIMGSRSFKIDEILPQNMGISTNLRFGISDIVCSMSEIEALCKVEEMIVEMKKTYNVDDKLIDGLMKLHINYKIYYFSMRRLSEMISLKTIYDMDKISNINCHQVLDSLCVKMDSRKEFGRMFIEMAKLTLSILASLVLYDNDAESYYQYMFYMTILEVYLSYLNSEELKEFATHCEQVNVKDSKIKDGLRKILVKGKEEH